MYTILGAGLSGLSVADHLAKKNISFNLYEAKNHGGGHIYSEVVDGFTWDEGPHVSFTKYDYVKNYFAANCNNDFLEYATKPINYFKGNWINHPAQSNMYAIPEPLRSECIDDVIVARQRDIKIDNISDYQQWIDYAFGKTFAQAFPAAYTRKYWTTSPKNLTTDWIGKRIYFPEIDDMVKSTNGPLEKQTHYISKVRYPKHGGYYSYIKQIEANLPIIYNKAVKYISFINKQLQFEDGEVVTFDNIINTLPLPWIIAHSDAPIDVKSAAMDLKCSKVLIINAVLNHPSPIDNHWIYVYDESFYSTRINFTNLLSAENGVDGKSGIQVEVYFSDYNPLNGNIEEIIKKVLTELVEMKLALDDNSIESYHYRFLNWANVIFDNKRVSAQNIIFNWLEKVGMVREEDDLLPMTNWDEDPIGPLGSVIMAGRFAQWKYYWTDDCVLRGRNIALRLNK